MRWIVSVGTLMLVGLVVGLGLAGLFRVQTYLNHQAELHFEVQKGLPATKVSVAEHGLRSPDSEPKQLVAGEIDRSVNTPALDEATAISDFTGSTERNALAGEPRLQHTRKIGVADLTKRELRTSRAKGASFPYRSSGPERNHQFTWCRENNSDRPQSDCRRSRRWCFVSQLAAGCRSMRSHAPLICCIFNVNRRRSISSRTKSGCHTR